MALKGKQGYWKNEMIPMHLGHCIALNCHQRISDVPGQAGLKSLGLGWAALPGFRDAHRTIVRVQPYICMVM